MEDAAGPGPICILGMHRSGTSMVARLLAHCGLHLGSPADLMPASPENPDGYFESLRFRAVNDEILARSGGSWDHPPAFSPAWWEDARLDDVRARAIRLGRELGREGRWGFKDPRNCLTLGLWRSLWPGLRVVLCVRHPLEVAWSLEDSRHGIAPARGIALFCAYHDILASQSPKGSSLLTTHYDSFFYDPVAELERLLQALLLPCDPARVREAAAKVTGERRRHAAAGQPLDGPEMRAVRDTYARLCAEAGPVFARLREDTGFQASQREAALLLMRESLVLARSRARAAERSADRSAEEGRVEAARLQVELSRLRDWNEEVSSSLVFRATSRLWRLRDLFLPAGSLRRAFFVRLRGALLAGPSGLRRAGGRGQEAQGGAAAPFADADYELHQRRMAALEPAAPPRVTLAGRAPQVRLVTLLGREPETSLLETAAALRAQLFGGWSWDVHALPDQPEALAALAGLAREDRRIRVHEPGAERSRLLAGIRALLASREEDPVGLLCPGDRPAPEALRELTAALHERSVDLCYADHDRLDSRGCRAEPLFKPEWSPELMLSLDLLAPLALFRARLLDEVPPPIGPNGEHWRREVHLRVGERAQAVRRVARVLCHARAAGASDLDSARGSLERSLARSGRLSPQVRFTLQGWPEVRFAPRAQPLVSVVIPSRDKPELLGPCLDTLFSLTTYPRFEVVVVDTGSAEAATSELYARFRDRPGFRVVDQPGPFNFSVACNRGARAAAGELLLFLNNDTEIVQGDWIDGLAQWMEVPGIGIVGAKLLFPDDRVQHSGVVVGMGGLAGHVFHGAREHTASPYGGDDWYRDLSAVTAACLMVSRQLLFRLGGFDESFQLGYGDVDLCLRARRAGFRILYTPGVRAIHHESMTHRRRVPRADFEQISARLLRFGLLDGDPYYNPNLSYSSTLPRLRQSAQDSPRHLNRAFLARLPAKELIHVPEDLR